VSAKTWFIRRSFHFRTVVEVLREIGGKPSPFFFRNVFRNLGKEIGQRVRVVGSLGTHSLLFFLKQLKPFPDYVVRRVIPASSKLLCDEAF